MFLTFGFSQEVLLRTDWKGAQSSLLFFPAYEINMSDLHWFHAEMVLEIVQFECTNRTL